MADLVIRHFNKYIITVKVVCKKMAGELVIMISFAILFIFMADLSLAANDTEPFRCIICSEADCFPGFIKLGDYCYYFSESSEDWDNAHTSCKTKQADLAHPLNEKENSLINDHMQMHLSINFPGQFGFYLGGNSKQDKSKWVWSFNNKPIEFNKWAPTKPDDPDVEGCMVSYTDKGSEFKWRNSPCMETYPYVCQQIKI